MIIRKKRSNDSDSLELLTEVLQTDIQRFLALFGFLLMSIFALVQSIPITAKEMETKVHDMTRTIAEQNQKIENLKKENQNLADVVAKALSERDINRKKKQDLKKANNQIKKLHQQLIDLKKQMFAKKPDTSQLQKKLVERDKKIEKIEQDQQKVAHKIQQDGDVTKKSKKTEKAKGGLFFSSPEDLDRLLCDNAVSLYFQVKQGPSFEALCRSGNIQFQNKDLPSNLFGGWIPKEQVPTRVLNAFQDFTTLSSRENTVIVQFLPDLEQKIRRMPMGARVLIHGDGRVENENG